jgi:hypothetical protein
MWLAPQPILASIRPARSVHKWPIKRALIKADDSTKIAPSCSFGLGTIHEDGGFSLQEAVMAQEFRPGEIVPESGIYEITHDPNSSRNAAGSYGHQRPALSDVS